MIIQIDINHNSGVVVTVETGNSSSTIHLGTLQVILRARWAYTIFVECASERVSMNDDSNNARSQKLKRQVFLSRVSRVFPRSLGNNKGGRDVSNRIDLSIHSVR
jgi:hypothetical protein